MPTIDIPPGALDVVLQALSRHVPDREIRAMGSRAEGRGKPFSDLDLVVMGNEPLGLRTLGQLRDAFDDSNLPFAVDIIEWASCSDGFRRLVETHAKPFRSPTLVTSR
jgi:predicted nucleotidyltransferase